MDIELMEKMPQSRTEARRQAIIHAATALFLEKGFEKTTLSDIVEASGGSRATIYEQFGDKAGLFRTIMLQRCERLQRTLDGIDAEGRDVEAALTDFAESFVTVLLEKESLSIKRIIYGEGNRFPAITQAMMQAGPNVIDAKLAQYFRSQTAAGQLAIGNPEVAAEVFLGMINGRIVFEHIIGMDRGLTPAQLRELIVQSVRIFLYGAVGRSAD